MRTTTNSDEVPASVGGFHGTTDDSHSQHHNYRQSGTSQAQQQQNTPLMGIAHRHDEALSHNPTPSETLMERRDYGHKEDDTEPLITGTLGASPARSAVDGDIGGADGTSNMPRTILFPESLYGEATEPARPARQSAATPSTPRKAYGTEEGLMPPPPTSSPSSTRSPSGSARSGQRKRVNSDGSNNSTLLVEMLMRSSLARALRPRVGSSSEFMDERVLHVAENTEVDGHEEPNSDGIDNDASDSDGCAKKHANLSPRYDYNASWNVGGHHHREAADATVATSTTSHTSGVLSEAVAASAAVAAAVNNSDVRPITPSDMVLSASAETSDGNSRSTPQSACSAGHLSRQRRRARPMAESQSSLPSSPIHLIPRRRTRSTPNAGSAYTSHSPNQSSSHRRREYAHQKYHTEGLRGADSVDAVDEFDDVRNISSSAPNTDGDAGENPFNNFDGAPVVPRVGTGLNREDSVRSASTSSSSSITHRRRSRGPGGQVDPSGTTIFGGHSAPSVSSFSGSVSTVTGVSLHPPAQVRTFHHHNSVTRAGENSRTNTSDEIVETNPAARSLRASLDAGMAAISRWARSHAGVAGSAAASAAQAGGHGPPRSSRAATMQLGEEDLFALANAGADPRRSISALEEEQRLGGVGNYGLGGLSVFAPIAEEEDGTGAGGRNRAFSEPDRARVRNFFTRRAVNNRGGSPPQRSNPSRLFGTTSGTAQIGGDVISHLSSSTDIASGARTLSTAAMSSSLFHSSSMPPQAAARVMNANANRNIDDQIDLIERGSINNDDSMEDVIDNSSRREANEISRENAIVSSNVSDNRGDSDGDDEDLEPQIPTTRADLDRRARRRWVRINQRFQVLITFVALIFSLILFAVLVCWIVMTSSYVVSIDKPCDVPLKKYFWLATIQLVFDVFRTDIMRHILRWDPNQGQRIPKRVVIYHMAYLIYAICVLRIGVKSVYFSPESTCPDSAPEFFSAAAAFVTLSLAAWSTIVVGYLFPFCFVAIILTRNGYSPSADIEGGEEAINAAIPGVFPNYHANSGAPPGCIDRLQVIMLHEFPDDYPRECCICMSDFSEGEVIVVTNCEHVFHKRCCQEWLQQARTCPVCRTDLPSALGMSEHGSDDGSWDGDPSRPRPNRPPLNREEFHQEVVSLLRLLRQHEERLRDRLAHPEDEREDEIDADQRSEGTTSDNISLPRSSYANRSGDLEEERMEHEESASLPSYRSRRSQ